MKRAFKIFLAVTLSCVLSFAQSPNVFAQEKRIAQPYGISDRTPPILISISIDKTTLSVPDSFSVTIQATDDLSGIQDIAICYLDGYDHYFLKSLATSGTAIFTRNFNYSTNFGTVKIATICLTDCAGNQQYYVIDPTQEELSNGYKKLSKRFCVHIKK